MRMEALFKNLSKGLRKTSGHGDSANTMNPWTMTAALRRLSSNGFTFSTVLDIGASDGKWTRDALAVFPDAYYLLFEPLEERRRELERLEDESPRVTFEVAAAGSVLGEVSFIVTEDLDGSRAVLNEPLDGVNRQVRLTTIDHALRTRGLPPPHLLKLDVHGYELPILAGAAATLKETRVAVIEAYNFHITADSPTFHELVLHMDRLGFYCIDIVDPYRMSAEGFEWQVDLFFARKDDPIFHGQSLRF